MTGLLITSWLSFLNTPALTVVGDMDKITLSTYWMDSGQLWPHLGRGEGLAFVRPLGFTFSKDALSGHHCCIRCHPKPPPPHLVSVLPRHCKLCKDRTVKLVSTSVVVYTQESFNTASWVNEWTKQWKTNKSQRPFPQFCHCLTFKLS